MVKVTSSFQMFYCRHHDIINRYGIYVFQMTMYMFCLSWSQSGPFLVHCNKIDTTNTNSRTRTTYPSEHLRSLSVLVGLVFCVVFCRSLFVSLFVFFGHWIVWFTLLISPSFAYTMIVIISLTIYPVEYHWLHIPWNIITTYPVGYHWLHIPWNIIAINPVITYSID